MPHHSVALDDLTNFELDAVWLRVGRLPLVAEQDVLRLEVAMHNALAHHRLHRASCNKFTRISTYIASKNV